MAKNINAYTTENSKFLNRQIGPSTDTGYAVSVPNVSANDPNKNNWNVQLIKLNNKYLNLWVEEASVDFSMSGKTGQSRYKREFYPHSFNEPTLRLVGKMPNQREYNKLAAFVRESHSEALHGSTNTTETSREQQKVYPTVTLLMKSTDFLRQAQPRTQKGAHRGMKLEGYIKSIAAGATKFEFAPAFEIQFVVAAANGTVGIYEDTLVAGSQIKSWMTLFKVNQFGATSGIKIHSDIAKADAAQRAPTIAADTAAGIISETVINPLNDTIGNIFNPTK